MPLSAPPALGADPERFDPARVPAAEMVDGAEPATPRGVQRDRDLLVECWRGSDAATPESGERDPGRPVAPLVRKGAFAAVCLPQVGPVTVCGREDAALVLDRFVGGVSEPVVSA